jgi:hypothetical protein
MVNIAVEHLKAEQLVAVGLNATSALLYIKFPRSVWNALFSRLTKLNVRIFRPTILYGHQIWSRGEHAVRASCRLVKTVTGSNSRIEEITYSRTL